MWIALTSPRRDGTQSEVILYYVEPGQNTSLAMQKCGTTLAYVEKSSFTKIFSNHVML